MGVLVIFCIRTLQRGRLRGFGIGFGRRRCGLRVRCCRRLGRHRRRIHSLQRSIGGCVLAVRTITRRNSARRLRGVTRTTASIFRHSAGVSTIKGPIISTLLGCCLQVTREGGVGIGLSIAVPRILAVSSLSLDVVVKGAFSGTVRTYYSLPTRREVVRLRLHGRCQDLFCQLRGPCDSASHKVHVKRCRNCKLGGVGHVIRRGRNSFCAGGGSNIFAIRIHLGYRGWGVLLGRYFTFTYALYISFV